MADEPTKRRDSGPVPLEPILSADESDAADEAAARAAKPSVREQEAQRASAARDQRAADRPDPRRDYDKPLCAPGGLGWKPLLIIAAALAMLAAIIALAQTPRAEGEAFWAWFKPASGAAARVLLGLPVQFVGACAAFAMTAWYVGRPAGPLSVATPRLAVIVALVTLALRTRLGFSGDVLVAWALGAGVYFLGALALFRVPPRVAGVLVAMHLLAWALLEGLAAYVYWTN